MKLADDYDPTPEEIWGTPEEIIRDAAEIHWPKLRQLVALCLRCWRINGLAKYRYVNELVVLPDGTHTTAEDWEAETLKAHQKKGARYKAFCDDCNTITFQIAEGVR